MCTTCGCGRKPRNRIPDDLPRNAASGDGRRVAVMEDMLARNNRSAARLRAHLEAHGILAVNLMSSPGSGKTELLVALIRAMGGGGAPVTVVEGDQQTENDARRIRETGARAVQINTVNGCHLEAGRAAMAVLELAPADRTCLFVENVGNLVCPAEFDLGESRRVVVLSVTEGDDKPLKYPGMFATADLLVINKTDLLPYVDFSPDACEANARRIRPGLEVLRVSARTGEGMGGLLAWVRREMAAVRDGKGGG